MKISRATLYKYFSTKEEIIDFNIEVFIEFINEHAFSPLHSDHSYGIRFQQLFEQSVSLKQDEILRGILP
ncbi:helix-turn-helix transcriptional regulator [Cohnella fermenti]|uniref:Helix-turn-helix transcriptional regulator n=1 Tax=Cohnella fermenti TaxID=2565925 RepID=A0A4S4BNL1_9BACL|nr:helix-turn-helix transcriptional regulator [Cohnella fermenti]THF76413.1 helix-turn-helix transcriptional regulator [Cohnella fermenti]